MTGMISANNFGRPAFGKWSNTGSLPVEHGA